MNRSFNIRIATFDDAEHLPAIEISAGKVFLNVPGLEWIADDNVVSAEKHREFMQSGAVWVASDKDKNLVAFISCEIQDGRLHIWELAVHAMAQRGGLGRRMVQTAINHAQAAGLSEITLTTFRDVAFNAVFYEKLGFRIIEAEHLAPWLSKILGDEQQSGLPGDRRCAMQMRL